MKPTLIRPKQDGVRWGVVDPQHGFVLLYSGKEKDVRRFELREDETGSILGRVDEDGNVMLHIVLAGGFHAELPISKGEARQICEDE